MTLRLDTQTCAILADKGTLGRHSRQQLVAQLRGMGRTGYVTVVDAGDGMKVAVLSLATVSL